jgi:hypothetical protein
MYRFPLFVVVVIVFRSLFKGKRIIAASRVFFNTVWATHTLLQEIPNFNFTSDV